MDSLGSEAGCTIAKGNSLGLGIFVGSLSDPFNGDTD